LEDVVNNIDKFIEKMKEQKNGFEEVWENKRNHRELLLDIIGVRVAKKITTSELAAMTGLKQSAISRFENGNNATLDTLFKITKALGISVKIK